MKNITIITINYNSEKETNELLLSLKKANRSEYKIKIIVIDNGSKKPFTLLDQEKSENISIIRSVVNTGFSGGCNIGIKEALKHSADYLLFINNDTTVDSSMIYNLLNVLVRDPNIGITTPKIYFAKGNEFHRDRYKFSELGKVLWFAGGNIDWKNIQSIHLGMNEVDHGQYNNIEKIEFATGCCMLIKREIIEKIGLFDEKYFLYYEDSDFSERIKKAGYEIYYVPDAIMYHKNAQSTGGSGGHLHDYFLTRNQMLFGMKYAPLKTKLALIRQSVRLLIGGREYQKKGVRDFYLNKLGKGTFFDHE